MTAPKLTTTQWLICIIASIGFAFDIYELLMLPLIVKPALAALGGSHVPFFVAAAIATVNGLVAIKRLPETRRPEVHALPSLKGVARVRSLCGLDAPIGSRGQGRFGTIRRVGHGRQPSYQSAPISRRYSLWSSERTGGTTQSTLIDRR